MIKNLPNLFLKGTIQSVDQIKIEYAPSPASDYLDDKTSFDTYIEYTDTDGLKNILGIEVKYTEREYTLKKGSSEEKKLKDAQSTYRQVSKNSKLYKSDAELELMKDDYRQVWRNHLLGESMLQKHPEKYNRFTSITFFPEGNTHFKRISKEYLAMMHDHARDRFIPITYESFIESVRKHSANDEHKRWADYLEKRYIVKL